MNIFKKILNGFNMKASFGQMMNITGASWKTKDTESYIKEGYMINNVVFRCVDLVAKNMASVPLKVTQTKNDESVLVDKTHPLQKLLKVLCHAPCHFCSLYYNYPLDI